VLNARRHRAARIVALAVIVCLGADGLFWMKERFWHHELRVTYIDVGQGNAALIEMPGGRCGLIDGGGFADNASFDVGARIIAPLLWRKKILSLDTLVLSHPNCDHLNGLIYIVRHFNVAEVWSNGQPVQTYGYRCFTRAIQEAAIAAPAFVKLKRRQVYNGVVFEVLYPPRDFLRRGRAEHWRDANNNSLVIKVTYGRHSLLFPGDIEARAERELVELAGGCLPCTVLLAPHHGSRSSSSQDFLKAVKPKAVVVSAGWRNRYRFPHAEVLQRYRRMGCAVYRTDRHGAVRVETDGQRVEMETFLSPRFSAL
jgi:competence protein ComEC